MDEINIPASQYPRIVVIGGGFGGINFIKSMADAPYQIVLLDQNNFHQFLPLLYQVATCGLEPDGIIFPLRKLFERQDNVCFRMTSVKEIDAAGKIVITASGTIAYDKLVIATGSITNFFGNVELEQRCIGMKDIREALNIRSLVLENLEAAAVSSDPDEREALTNFVVVGGGPAGVETVGALAEFKRYILNKDYPDIDDDVMKVYLVQSGGQLLKGMSEDAGLSALQDLKKMGVEIILHNRVKSYDGTTVFTDKGLELKSRAVVWTAGVQGSLPAGISTTALAAGSRINVDRFNKVVGMPGIYAIGDIARMATDEAPEGHPMVATAAIQQGAHLAKNLRKQLANEPMIPFQYFDKGSLATIGKRRAVADIGKHHLHGFVAWLIWCFVHIFYLIGFRNKFLVFTNWLMSYMTYEKGNRFIVRRFREM
ncbi:MAG: NAD(P)/FAD-dependent oxidoreductase [Verrucomicrobiae bacterium]|nr:NAD(P)/FAD-dependent oxidoreductase [Verrucomicrobiae bacterium]